MDIIEFKNNRFSPNTLYIFHCFTSSFKSGYTNNEEYNGQPLFAFDVKQVKTDNTVMGGEQYQLKFGESRDAFEADGGSDQIIYADNSTILQATDIGEPAIYNWYNQNNEIVHVGKNYAVSPNITSNYKLEVIANADGFKDYDGVKVIVINNYIENISPNPAQTEITVEYNVEETCSPYIRLQNNSTFILSNVYTLDELQQEIIINISNYPSGSYTVLLFCNDEVSDSKGLIIH